MPAGGFRPGGGRPKRSRDVLPRRRRPKTGSTSDTVSADTAEPVDETPEQYLLRIMRDPAADVARRDRCAAILAGLQARWSRPQGKRADEAAAAEAAVASGKFQPGQPPSAPPKPIPSKFLPPAAPTHPPVWDVLFRGDPSDDDAC
jgi:hypothetical protein